MDLSQSLFQQMVFCNIYKMYIKCIIRCSHNPYFSRWFSAIKDGKKAKEALFMSQSLFQQMVFCNEEEPEVEVKYFQVTILILVDGFLQLQLKQSYGIRIWWSQSLFQQMVFCNNESHRVLINLEHVTILILVDGFLQ